MEKTNAYEKFEELAVVDFFKVENLYEFRAENKKSQEDFTKAIDRLIHSLSTMLFELQI